ncbi:hypothetical protein MesoLj131b_70740 (plasmid) [Mesorhizobium sp. 131-2-5]|nr:hypothetical protein MesoLj131b_70740 [Mesorhizobium sp. 131-2-5]
MSIQLLASLNRYVWIPRHFCSKTGLLATPLLKRNVALPTLWIYVAVVLQPTLRAMRNLAVDPRIAKSARFAKLRRWSSPIRRPFSEPKDGL